MPKKCSPLISDQAIEFYTGNFDNLNAGVTYTLEAFRDLYRRTLSDTKGIFSEGELSLFIDVFNSTFLTPQLAGQQIIVQVEDGCDLDHLDDKWGCDKIALVSKLKALPIFALACLEVWACAFWRSKNSKGEIGVYGAGEFEKWVEMLS